MKTIWTCIILAGFANPAIASETVYRCDDRSTIAAILQTKGSTGLVRLTLTPQGKNLVLPQVLSADGGRYANDDVEFWIKGRTARFTRAGDTTECEVQ
jgi:membrane-bound inhibitor of C-type lysozyme